MLTLKVLGYELSRTTALATVILADERRSQNVGGNHQAKTNKYNRNGKCSAKRKN